MAKKTYPYSFFVLSEFFLVFSGLLLSLYLSISHYRNYTDPLYSSFCAISRAINCDTVSQSPWSVMVGLPVALWGFFAYGFYFIFLIQVRRKGEADDIWNMLFILGVLYSVSSLFFGYISVSNIHSFCILCIATYAINFLLLYQTWLLCRRFNISFFPPEPKKIWNSVVSRKWLRISLLTLCTCIICVTLSMPHYWKFDRVVDFSVIPNGITENGHPWLGADDPVVTIDVFSDYQCFQCYKMQFLLRTLIKENPGKIKLIHHHYPMDHEVNAVVVPESFHVGAGKMAMLAIYATSKGKFWETNDILYEIGRTKRTFRLALVSDMVDIPVREFAWALESKEVKERLRYDIWHGMKLGITGTPTFVIDGKVYTGFIPSEILNEVLSE